MSDEASRTGARSSDELSDEEMGSVAGGLSYPVPEEETTTDPTKDSVSETTKGSTTDTYENPKVAPKK